ncbi:MFS transporter, CP family, cyanate transporter [Cellulosimicrobium aquatile]|uniref:MFS transporter, CP family, cyanate transporter n=1 Tax=Cellulosimicrobium aquatile TaxID=1612203 RepID=A0A1N6V8Z8_9MICO|nr:MFS transporter [Cellulosimicrobium aquatile]SIQ74312.1 MFS transporter, CP family, cyanate transporter [Cellulosimicrobium aquatile]
MPSSRPPRPSTFRGGIDGVLLVAVLLVAVNLRAPLTALPPVVADVAADLDLTAAAAGLLTGIPVLCFALATPAVAGLLGRSSLRTAIAVALTLIVAGTVLRSADLAALGAAGTFAGTVLLGLGITTANLAVPMIAQRDFPGHVATVTGLYTAAINVGTVATTALTAPLADAVGWRWALASWSVLAVVALVWWLRAVPREAREPRGVSAETVPGPAASETKAGAAGDAAEADVLAAAAAEGVTGTDPTTARERHVLATPFTWWLCAMFALQSSSFYALTAWLPLVLEDLAGIPRSASGGAASLFQGFAIVGGLAVPLAARRLSLRQTFVGIAVLWLTLPVGLLAAPGLWAVWASAAGVAQAANFVVIFTLVAQRYPTVRRGRQASATVQSVGYCLAAVAPTAAGALQTATGTWTVPVAVVLGALVVMTGIGLVLTGAPRRRAG